MGINTVTPFLDLDIRGDDDFSDGGELQLATPSMSHFIRMFGGREGDKNPFLAFRDIDTFHFVTTSPDWLTFKRRMTIGPSGRIGIGEDNPLSILHINLADNTTNEYLRFTSYQNPLAWIFHQIHPATGGLSLKTLSNNRNFQLVSSNGLNRALFITSHDTFSKVSLVPDGGEVGIGTTDANAKLHVRADGTATDPQLRLTETSQGDNVTIKFENTNDFPLFWDIRATTDVSASNSLFRFYHNAGGGPATEKLSITGEGKVGVGLAVPAATLDVAGKIKITDDADAPVAGMIRYNVSTQDFEGFDGTTWLSLTSKGLTGGWGVPHLSTMENQQIIASDGANADHFGSAVAIAGNYAIVGAPFHDTNGNIGEGKAYVFHYNGLSWVQHSILTGLINQDYAQFGCSVTIQNDKMVIGASGVNVGSHEGQGKIFIYSLVNNVWEFQTSLTSSDGNNNDQFGSSVSISGNYILVGAPGATHNGYPALGKAYVFHWTGTEWLEQSILTPSEGGSSDHFGQSVSISGDYLVVGEPLLNVNGLSNSGKAFVYKRSAQLWTLESSLMADEYTVADNFGNSVSISDDQIVIGAFGHDVDGYNNSGAAYVFIRTGSTWNQQQKLYMVDLMPGSTFGRNVTMHNDYILVSSDVTVNGIENLGKAYLYQESNGTYNLISTILPNGGQANDNFSCSLAISPNCILVGSRSHDGGGITDSGKVYFFRRN